MFLLRDRHRTTSTIAEDNVSLMTTENKQHLDPIPVKNVNQPLSRHDVDEYVNSKLDWCTSHRLPYVRLGGRLCDGFKSSGISTVVKGTYHESTILHMSEHCQEMKAMVKLLKKNNSKRADDEFTMMHILSKRSPHLFVKPYGNGCIEGRQLIAFCKEDQAACDDAIAIVMERGEGDCCAYLAKTNLGTHPPMIPPPLYHPSTNPSTNPSTYHLLTPRWSETTAGSP